MEGEDTGDTVKEWLGEGGGGVMWNVERKRERGGGGGGIWGAKPK